ncbi:hypothetical protein ACO0QE_003871 [Hanseniaspora vineae]
MSGNEEQEAHLATNNTKLPTREQVQEHSTPSKPNFMNENSKNNKEHATLANVTESRQPEEEHFDAEMDNGVIVIDTYQPEKKDIADENKTKETKEYSEHSEAHGSPKVEPLAHDQMSEETTAEATSHPQTETAEHEYPGEQDGDGEMSPSTYNEYYEYNDENEVIVKDEEDVFKNVALGLEGKYRDLLIDFWQTLINQIESLNENDLEEAQANSETDSNAPPSSSSSSSSSSVVVGIQDSFKTHNLPLARIKKVMKIDENVKMISAETPILFAQTCEIFITELTLRAWTIADENKRRTLQKQDVVEALQKSDMYDFLIDIVPRQLNK